MLKTAVISTMIRLEAVAACGGWASRNTSTGTARIPPPAPSAPTTTPTPRPTTMAGRGISMGAPRVGQGGGAPELIVVRARTGLESWIPSPRSRHVRHPSRGSSCTGGSTVGGHGRAAGRDLVQRDAGAAAAGRQLPGATRSEEHTSELQSRGHLVCRLLLEKKTTKANTSS